MGVVHSKIVTDLSKHLNVTDQSVRDAYNQTSQANRNIINSALESIGGDAFRHVVKSTFTRNGNAIQITGPIIIQVVNGQARDVQAALDGIVKILNARIAESESECEDHAGTWRGSSAHRTDLASTWVLPAACSGLGSIELPAHISPADTSFVKVERKGRKLVLGVSRNGIHEATVEVTQVSKTRWVGTLFEISAGNTSPFQLVKA